MAFEVFLNEHIVENWSFRTRQQQESTKDQLIEVIGDVNFRQMDKAIARDYKTKPLQYPKNRNKGKHGTTMTQELTFEGCKTISMFFRT